MTAKKKILLHVGTHKTGTTSLQRMMALHRPHLLERGICYPETDRPPFPHHIKHKNLRAALIEGPRAFAREKAAFLDEFARSGANTLMMSGEGLWRMPVKALNLMRELAEDFEIEIICFLRRQDRFLESLWSQLSKEGRAKAHIDVFVRLPRQAAGPDYLVELDRWARFARVNAIGFEQACADGLVESFNKATGLDLPPETRLNNASPDMRTAAIMAAFNRRGIAHDWRIIEASLEGPSRRHALGARLRAEIMARCAAQNAKLARRYGVHFPDDMPEEPDDPVPEPGEEMLVQLLPEGQGLR